VAFRLNDALFIESVKRDVSASIKTFRGFVEIGVQEARHARRPEGNIRVSVEGRSWN
jgi:hypothetical protein